MGGLRSCCRPCWGAAQTCLEIDEELIQVDASETVGSLGIVKCRFAHESLLVAADGMIDEAVEGHHLYLCTTLLR